MSNLIESIQIETNRAREILKMYEEIPQGAFGAHFIRQTIQKSEKAIASGDVVQMLEVFAELKDVQ